MDWKKACGCNCEKERGCGVDGGVGEVGGVGGVLMECVSMPAQDFKIKCVITYVFLNK